MYEADAEIDGKQLLMFCWSTNHVFNITSVSIKTHEHLSIQMMKSEHSVLIEAKTQRLHNVMAPVSSLFNLKHLVTSCLMWSN